MIKSERSIFYCHGCARTYDEAGLFFSGPLAQKIGRIVYPVKGCKPCMAAGDRIGNAYREWIAGKWSPIDAAMGRYS